MLKINYEKCIACGLCVKDCPKDSLSIEDGKLKYDSSYCFECAHCFAVCPKEAIEFDNLDNSEVIQVEEGRGLDKDDLLYMMQIRRSIRHFTSEKVSDEDINYLIKAGHYAPTASNTQTVRFVIFKDTKEEIHEMLKILSDLAKDPNSSLNEVQRERYAKQFVEMLSDFEERGIDRLFHGAPLVVMVVSKDMVDGALAASNIELMAKTLGLGACYVGFAVLASKDEKQKEIIGLEKGEKLAACLAIGHPDVKYLRNAIKKKLNLIEK